MLFLAVSPWRQNSLAACISSSLQSKSRLNDVNSTFDRSRLFRLLLNLTMTCMKIQSKPLHLLRFLDFFQNSLKIRFIGKLLANLLHETRRAWIMFWLWANWVCRDPSSEPSFSYKIECHIINILLTSLAWSIPYLMDPRFFPLVLWPVRFALGLKIYVAALCMQVSCTQNIWINFQTEVSSTLQASLSALL